MGDEITDERSDTALTQADITQLGQAIDETEAHTAWSLVDDEPEPRWWTPARITAAGVVAAVLAIGLAAVVALPHLGRPTLGDVAMVSPEWDDDDPELIPVGPSGFDISPPPPPPPAPTVTRTVSAPVPEARHVDNPNFTVSQMAEFDRQFLSAMVSRG
ncbi:hypothetical protein [Mycobacterium sp. 236(2023)]|uniref:hypothetical protein n=1 Tax=Mycobacterium sp. 236(2023) TaxID=3038163 RepID=UPI002415796E|nr:hypothetical protein [Mycobacterium sp. 236(2023)]MDG4667965.1 hypothetical protein [Mycobacterium sp. 236(2023)]